MRSSLYIVQEYMVHEICESEQMGSGARWAKIPGPVIGLRT